MAVKCQVPDIRDIYDINELFHPNLTSAKIQVNKKFAGYRFLTIKPADKDRAFAIMDTSLICV